MTGPLIVVAVGVGFAVLATILGLDWFFAGFTVGALFGIFLAVWAAAGGREMTP